MERTVNQARIIDQQKIILYSKNAHTESLAVAIRNNGWLNQACIMSFCVVNIQISVVCKGLK